MRQWRFMGILVILAVLMVGTWGYAPQVVDAVPKFDPARARALLSQAGWTPGPDGIVQKDGRRLRLVVLHLSGGVFLSLHQLVQAYLRAIGIDSELRGLEQAAALDALKRGDFDISANQINTASDPDVLYQVGHSTSIGALWNTARYRNPDLDRLLDSFYVQTDPFAMQATLEGVVYDVKSLPLFHVAWLRR